MIVPVTVPVTVTPGASSEKISQDAAPEVAPFCALKPKEPSGVVKVRSMLDGMNSPLAPSLRVSAVLRRREYPPASGRQQGGARGFAQVSIAQIRRSWQKAATPRVRLADPGVA